jgi:hypothetical protein
VEAGAQQEIPVLGAGDFDITADDGAVHVDPGVAVGVAGFVESGGEEAAFEAAGTEEGLLGEGDGQERCSLATFTWDKSWSVCCDGQRAKSS